MRRHHLAILTVSLALFLMPACASAPPASRAPTVDLTLITKEQIQKAVASTAYEVVKTIRGNWLTSGGAESFRYPIEVQVYVDGIRMGGPSALQNIPSQHVEYIRYYRGPDASARWGLDHGKGVIWVSTRPAKP